MKHLVILNFFPAFNPPASGGEMRVGALYRELSEKYKITLLSSTDFGARYEEIKHAPNLLELRFPKDDNWRNAYRTLNASGVEGELSGLAFALAVSNPKCALTAKAKALAKTADLIVHEFPFSEPIFSEGCPCGEIYNSHNFEVSLLSSLVHGAGVEAAQLKLINLERNLVKRSKRVFATSSTDAEKFRLFYGAPAEKISVCPNGFDADELDDIVERRANSFLRTNEKFTLVFIGSSHQPNVEAVEYILTLAQGVPECEFVIGGGVCTEFNGRSFSENIKMCGSLSQVEKCNILISADVILNPVVLGSGTSLKALEALGAKIPMISTPEGVRGLGLRHHRDCMIVSRSEFSEAIETLRNDESLRNQICLNGLAFVKKNYSWKSIAAKFAKEIFKPVAKHVFQCPITLALNDYSVVKDGSGGISRIRNVLGNLARDVILLSFGDRFDVVLVSENFLTVTFAKTSAHVSYQEAVNDSQPMSANDAVAAIFALHNRTLVSVLSELISRADAIIFEHPYMASLLDVIDNVSPDIPVIYSAHNVEAVHKLSIYRGHKAAPSLNQFISEIELRLIQKAKLVVTCTKSDENYFKKFNKSTLVIPNGSNIPAVFSDGSRDLAEIPRIGFLGSAHGPNVEAADFIVAQLANRFPQFNFEFIGGVCSALQRPLPANVILHGEVNTEEKSHILSQWSIALNPIESGGGSSLKLPDYMSHGLPTVNTELGSRGFDIQVKGAGLVCKRKDFAKAIRLMIEAPQKLVIMSKNARDYAIGELSWKAIIEPYRSALDAAKRGEIHASYKPKILVVTYRYTEPTLGGAEEYLVEVLKRIRPWTSQLDLVAIDIEEITNHHHFGTKFSGRSGGATLRIGDLFDRAEYFPPDTKDETEIIESARNIERSWAKEEMDLFRPFIRRLAWDSKLHLLAGFFWPEVHNGVVRRWTSPTFSFLVPPLTHIFQMSGYGAHEKQILMSLLHVDESGQTTQIAEFVSLIGRHFSQSISIPQIHKSGAIILTCEVSEHSTEGDHRPLGVLLESVSALFGVDGRADSTSQFSQIGWSSADLTEVHDEHLRTVDFKEWVATLNDLAQKRTPEIDLAFASIRGPHSVQMNEWLKHNASKYDCILVQGVPFDVIPSSVKSIKDASPTTRVVTLPHFHGDDRFYHWRNYTNAFERADKTLLFSESIANGLALDSKFSVVPGGGVNLEEAMDPNAAKAFNAIRPTNNRFFLVLGRKTSSKGYNDAIEAQQLLRNAGQIVDIILIGPDEDGLPVSGDGVYYMGRQPRAIIRGALASCIAVVTMSRSESFGIVLCEAWLFGKPVIANRNCYSFREIMTLTSDPFLAGTVEELREIMNLLAGDSALCDRAGDEGSEVVAENYSWETVAARLFENLLAPH